MRNISFALTTEQVRSQTKTVTRRMNWQQLKPGTLLQPVVKAQGLKKGERAQKIGGPIRVVSVRREPLGRVTFDDCAREGFPGMGPSEFVEFFGRFNRVREVCEGREHLHFSRACVATDHVTRIEFEYVREVQP